MPLTESQNVINGRELAEIKQAILTETQVATTAYQQALLDDLIKVTLRMFGLKDLLLSDTGKQSLAYLLHDAMQEHNAGKTKVKKNYKASLQHWIDETYPDLLQKADDEFKYMMGIQPRNLKRTLVETGEAPARVWGDDLDIRALLGSEITDPELIHHDGTYILPPVSVVAGDYASEQERDNPHTFLQNHLQAVCENNPDKSIAVLVPVNCGQLHWMLFKAEIENGKVEHARLIDSMSGASSVALHNVVKATKALGCDRVRSVARNVQTNGYSCMDYTVQKALQEKYAAVTDVPDVGLQAIHAAENAKDLRAAVVDTIIQHNEVLARNEKLVTDDVKRVFTQDVQPEQLENVLQAALTCPAGKTISHIIAENSRNWQIRFDEALAKTLDALYKDVANKCKADKDLFAEARVVAYQQTRDNFSLFASKAETPKAEVQEPVQSGKFGCHIQ